MIPQDAKIYVAGHRGLVGSAIWNNLLQRGYTNLVGRTHKELDLTDQLAVRRFFDEERPDAVVLAAAHVGGIMANSLYRADFMMENMQIQCNVIGEAYRHGVRKLLFLGSTCIYPKDAPQPMKEDCLLTSPLEYTNEEYAIAKIAGLKMCESYNLQYGTDYIAVMPTNLYGPNDNFHLENSHVMPAMMRKIYLAKLLNDGDWQAIRKDLAKRPVPGLSTAGPSSQPPVLGRNMAEPEPPVPGDYFAGPSETAILQALAHYGIEPNRVTLWGTGRPLREFLWSEEMADASVHILLNVSFADVCGVKDYAGNGAARRDIGEIRNCHINVGTGKELTIKELSELIVQTVGFQGEVIFDATKPDGTMRKLIDVSKLHSLGWHHKIEIAEGVQRLFDWYRHSLD